MMGGYGTHSWGMGWGWLISIIFLMALIWVGLRLVKQNKYTGRPSAKAALEILKERYARGEIDKQEFEKRKKDL